MALVQKHNPQQYWPKRLKSINPKSFSNHASEKGMDRAMTLRTLEHFRRSHPHVTASALTSILREVAENGVPEFHRREQMQEATQSLMDEITPHGRMLHEVTFVKHDGSELSTLVVNPFAFMYQAYRSDGGFQAMLDSTMRGLSSNVDTSLRIILYADEIVPGTEITHHNKRKMWAHIFPSRNS